MRNSDPVFESELYTIYLLESHQHMGLGRLLTSKIPQRLLEEGIHSMLVWVLAANPSRLFYEALGATQVSERDITIGNASLPEVAYGWTNLSSLLLLSG